MTGASTTSKLLAVASLALLASCGAPAVVPPTTRAPYLPTQHGKAVVHTAYPTLTGLSCPTVRTCVAVGQLSIGWSIRAFSEIKRGGRWSVAYIANPSGYKQAQLWSVACPSENDCLAVGQGSKTTFTAFHSVAAAWNGQRWRLVDAPGTGLVQVSCVGASNCYAVGTEGKRALFERWTGSRWSVVSPSITGLVQPLALDCLSRGACDVLGEQSRRSPPRYGAVRLALFRLEAGRWSTLPLEPPGWVGTFPGAFDFGQGSLSCVGIDHCELTAAAHVGTAGFVVAGTVVGRNWREDPGFRFASSPMRIPNNPLALEAVDCVSSSTCVGVGTWSLDLPLTGRPATAIRRAGHWGITPDPAGLLLTAVDCLSSTLCYAVGSFVSPQNPGVAIVEGSPNEWKAQQVPGPLAR